MSLQIEIERRANGSFACVVKNSIGSITFVRNAAGEICKSAWTTRFTDAEYHEAIQCAAKAIKESENEAWAARPARCFAPQRALF